MVISTTDAQGLYTKKLIDVYVERPKTTSFLRSFFPSATPAPTLELSIEVQRGFEKIAVDVVRGTDGNRNQWTKSTEKIFIPPYFREYLDITQLQLYDRLFGATEINDAVFAQFINDTADKVAQMREKIERTYELYCAQVLLDGIVQLQAGINIDFKRKAGSLVDSGVYWATNNDLFAQIQAGCTWLRQNGKTEGFIFNMIVGETAISHLMANTVFLGRQDLFNMKLDAIAPPQRNSVGGVYHGTLTAGPYQVAVWSYPEYYDNTAGVQTPYIDPKKYILMPQKPKFKMGFAAVPQLLKPGQPVRTGEFVISEYTDEKAKTHEIHVESAGLPIPTAVDQIYTQRVVS